MGRNLPYHFLFLGLIMKSSSSSLSLIILFLAFMSPFLDVCCCFCELSGLLGGGGDLIGVPIRSCFCLLCFFSCDFLALSGDSKPCSIILQENMSQPWSVAASHKVKHIVAICKFSILNCNDAQG